MLIYRWSNIGSMIVAHIKHISYAFVMKKSSVDEMIARVNEDNITYARTKRTVSVD